MLRAGVDIVKKQSKSTLIKTKLPDTAHDLTGKRFGKWLVLKYAGKKGSDHMWLSRCECGVERNIPQGNLVQRNSTQCRRCAWNSRRIPRTKLYRALRCVSRSGRFPKAWQDFDAFRMAVGEPPDDAARLKRHVSSMPHGPENSYWAMPTKYHLSRHMPDDFKEKYILEHKVLLNVRNAKTRDERTRSMIAARKAGFTYKMIAIAVGLTHQRVHQIIAKSLGERE
jgi:hypothetical protein